MFFHRSGGGISWLLVGLGNPGTQYAATRHNMGFMALDRLADREGFRFNKLRFRAWTGQWKVGDRQVLVMKPQTYMNLSGESVGEAARFYKIPADHVLVISDDVSLPAGKLRIRGGGSAGGHNGLKNIIQHLQCRRQPFHPAPGHRPIPPHQGGGRLPPARGARHGGLGHGQAHG